MPKRDDHDTLVKHAADSIDNVHGDTSVSQHETLRSLRYLAEHASELADLVESEIGDEEEAEDIVEGEEEE